MLQDKKEIMEIAHAWQRSAAMLTAVELGLFSQVGDGATSAEIAARAGTDPRCTDRVCNVLASMELMGKEGDVFTNSPAAERFLTANAPEFLSGLFHTANSQRNWGSLTEAVRKGTSVIELNWDSDEKREAFIEAMHRRSRDDVDDILRPLDLTDIERVLDVGGGSGAYSMAMCRRRNGLTAVVLDLPEVTPLTRKYIEDEGLSDRVTTQDGNYHDADYGSGFDLVFFSAIVHINSPEENEALMRKAFAALNPGGRIAIQDFVMAEDRLSPASAAMFALNMIVSTRAGDTYTRDEMSGWLESAGCVDVEFHPTGPTTAVVSGRKG